MTPRTWTLTIPAAGPWLNANQRLHWRARAEMVRNWRTVAHWHAIDRKLPKGLARVRIQAWLRFTDSRRRDVHNYSPTLKAIVDGLVDYGLIPDDNDKHLIGPDLRTGEPRRPGAVVLHIEELTS